MNGPSLATRVFLRVLERAQHGRVEIVFPDGKMQTYGEGENLIHVSVYDWQVFDLMFQKGDLGLAEGIIEGRMLVDDVAGLVEWACWNDHALGEAFRGKWYGLLAGRLRHLLARNTRVGAKKNILAHYDLGNEFYRLWLDGTMTYSSAIFETPDASLEEAQQKKYDRIIDELEIRSGDHVLEIGCGWGGFFSRAVERTGCKVTAVTISEAQARHNAEVIAQKTMSSHVSLKQLDYRDVEGRFDKVVSIEMIEAVGQRYWPAYFDKISSSLGPKGKCMVQGITIREDLFYSYSRGTDFIQQYVFPGGMLLTDRVFREQGAKSGIHLSNQFEFGSCYAKTLKLWRENFMAALDQVQALGFDEKFIRMWSLYLSYCEGAFRAGRINVGQYLLEA